MPRIPRDRVLTPGQMLAMVFTVSVFLWGAIILAVRWVMR